MKAGMVFWIYILHYLFFNENRNEKQLHRDRGRKNYCS